MNNRGRLVVDALIAVFVATVVLVLAAGLGVVAVIVGIVVLVCAISFAVGAAVRRWRGQPGAHRARDAGPP